MCADLCVSRDEPSDWLSCSSIKRQTMMDDRLTTLFFFFFLVKAMQSTHTTINVLGSPDVDIFNLHVQG